MLAQENQKLTHNIREDEAIKKDLENERTRLLNITNEFKLEIKDMTGDLKSRDDKCAFQNKQIDELNNNISKLNDIIRDLELKNSELKNQLNDKLYIVQKESRIRADREKDIDTMTKIIKEKERDAKKFLEEIEFIQTEKNKLYEDNTRMFNEIDRLKRHIYIITDMNQQVIQFFKYISLLISFYKLLVM